MKIFSYFFFLDKILQKCSLKIYIFIMEFHKYSTELFSLDIKLSVLNAYQFIHNFMIN